MEASHHLSLLPKGSYRINSQSASEGSYKINQSKNLFFV
jgi:hypothetical protein